MSGTKVSSKVLESPRVGGVIDNVPWTDGFNLDSERNDALDDIMLQTKWIQGETETA